MNIRNLSLFLLLGGLLMSPAQLRAQAEQTPERLLEDDETEQVEATPEPEPVLPPASNEVDVSESHFRRSMELRDEQLQRSPDLTTGSYSRGTGLQALEALPEESQKHLREQLREVIVENGPWTPADADSDYPYVPSEQAEKNGTLAGREQVAWGEMVSEYHEREEAIHSNARRSQAATAQLSSLGGNSGQNPDQNTGQSQNPSQNQDGQGESAEESDADDSGKEERAEALAQMLNASENSDSGASAGEVQPVETGTEQNALQLLTSRNQVPAQPAQDSDQASAQNSTQAQSADSEMKDSEVQDNQALSLDLSAEDVIAIDDLDKVIVDPREFEDNQD